MTMCFLQCLPEFYYLFNSKRNDEEIEKMCMKHFIVYEEIEEQKCIDRSRPTRKYNTDLIPTL